MKRGDRSGLQSAPRGDDEKVEVDSNEMVGLGPAQKKRSKSENGTGGGTGVNIARGDTNENEDATVLPSELSVQAKAPQLSGTPSPIPQQQQLNQPSIHGSMHPFYPMIPPYPPHGMAAMAPGPFGYPVMMAMQAAAAFAFSATTAPPPPQLRFGGSSQKDAQAEQNHKAKEDPEKTKPGVKEGRSKLYARMKAAEEELAAFKKALADGRESIETVKDLPHDDPSVRSTLEKFVAERARLAADNKRMEKELERQKEKMNDYREFHNKAKVKDGNKIRRLRRNCDRLKAQVEKLKCALKKKEEIEAAVTKASAAKRGRVIPHSAHENTAGTDGMDGDKATKAEESPPKSQRKNKTWDELILELEDFKKGYGHVRVPVHHKPLGSWVTRIRMEYQLLKKVEEKEKKERAQKHENSDGNIHDIAYERDDERDCRDNKMRKMTDSVGEEGQNSSEDDEGEETVERHLCAVGKGVIEDESERRNVSVTIPACRQESRTEVPRDPTATTHPEEVTAPMEELKPKTHASSSSLTLTKERITQLDSMGFVWVARGKVKTWDDSLGDLLAFKAANGHCRVPRYKRNLRLGEWVHQQRKYHRSKNPSYQPGGERYEKLVAAGFEWNNKGNRKTWEERFEQLVKYRRKFGYCKIIEEPVPGAAAKGETQGTTPVDDSQNAAGGEDNDEDGDEISSGKDREALQPCPDSVCDSAADRRALSRWAQYQRRHYMHFMQGKKSFLNKSRIRRLSDIGFDAVAKVKGEFKRRPGSGLKKNHPRWDERFNQLLEYLMEHGHTRVPQGWKTKNVLGTWVREQRRQYKWRQEGKRNAMTDERMKRLADIGFEWTLRDRPKR